MRLKKKLITLLIAVAFSVTAFLLPQNVQAATYRGVDVYEYDNISDYQQLKSDGIQILIQKASEGLTHNDALLQYRASHAIGAGFKIGYYHFADNTGQPEQEAQHFLNQINGLRSDTVLWLDIENESDWTKQQAVDYVNRFVTYVQARGYKMGLYSGLSFYYEYLYGNIPNDLPLWLASYGRQPLQYPNVSWQYSESGSLPGIVGNIDLDSFNDSIFIAQAPVATQNVQAATAIRDSKTATLQCNLSKLLQWKIVVDGIQGPQTEGATKQFQSMINITADGIPGPQTNAAINQVMSKPVLRAGSSGLAVRYLQYRLGITADSQFGEQTRLAVRAFEISNGLSVDSGIVGNEVWNELLKQP